MRFSHTRTCDADLVRKCESFYLLDMTRGFKVIPLELFINGGELIMARDFALYDDANVVVTPTAAPAVKSSASPSIWARFTQGLAASRRRKAESAVEKYIRSNGGRLTDNMEREISRKFGHMAGDGL